MESKTAVFEASRRVLEGIAYRMLGTLADAQDVVQDTYLQWLAVDEATVQSARSWLVTVCVRLCTNALGSARARRETYVGPWLPEPLTPVDDDAGVRFELDESISVALLVALEKLSPAERAAFLLHDVFDYDFDELAAILGKSNPACRKLASRARSAVRSQRPRPSVDPEEHRRIVAAFLSAIRQGELAQMEQVLSPSAHLYADGGGKVKTTVPLFGAEAIAHFFVNLWRGYAAAGTPLSADAAWFNGAPGVLIFEGDQMTTALSFHIEGDRIEKIFAQRNPDKLVRFTAVPR
jgi:RNA polymerase sigma-70 factor, ECF subfamily